LIKQIRNDYHTARTVVQKDGFTALSGKLGVYVQPRTKGPGHGSISRAFYMRTGLLAKVLDLDGQKATPWDILGA
jgi:DNA mismatch repair protein MutH